MKQLLNILYVTESDLSLHFINGAVEIRRDKDTFSRIPLHMLESIVSFS